MSPSERTPSGAAPDATRAPEAPQAPFAPELPRRGPGTGERAVWGLQTFAVLFALWLALNGGEAWPFGLACAAVGGAVGAALATGDPYPWRPLQLLAFAAWFVRASLLGGIDVARRALHPALPVQPHYLRHVLRLPKGQPRTLMVAVVSLLPGTLSADLDADGTLLVHVLGAGGGDGLDALERRVGRLFSLELD